MTKTKKKVVALLAIFAIGATAAAGVAMSAGYRATFADTEIGGEVTAAPGTEENPVTAITGVNTINKLYVAANAEMGEKELVYYMTFTPANSGLFTFTHSNPDIGVGNIECATEAPYGDWSDDFTVYSVELTKDVVYTVLINDFDWTLNLDNYELGSEYELTTPATITIAYASAAAGSTSETALPYTVGSTIIVPQGHDAVWYTFTSVSETTYYLIAMGGNAVVYKEFFGDLEEDVDVTSNYDEFNGEDVVYICVTPTATSAAEVQVLVKNEQEAGECIVTAVALPADGAVGDNKWYTYTAGENEKVTLTGNVSVDVYAGYNKVDTLNGDDEFVLTAGVTYHFFAPLHKEYDEGEEDGHVIYGTLVVSDVTAA